MFATGTTRVANLIHSGIVRQWPVNPTQRQISSETNNPPDMIPWARRWLWPDSGVPGHQPKKSVQESPRAQESSKDQGLFVRNRFVADLFRFRGSQNGS